jgi:hypothetical protein
MSFFRFIPILFLAASCGVTPTAAKLDESFRLAIGETAVLEEARMALTFRAVENDSRCPIDATCVWEGNALVEVVATRRDVPETILELNTTTDPRTATIDSFVVALESLEPGNRAGVRTDSSAYRAVLRVSRR